MSHLWSWGANSHGQLSQGLINEQIDQPTKIVQTFNIKKISCGGGHTLLIDVDGKIYSCGWNHKGQLASEVECCEFQRIWGLSGIKFINIATGWDFSCAVTDDKFLFVWGCNSHGQLGLPKDHFYENVKPVRLHVNACAVAMGLRHSVIINSKGEVWATGCGKYGQLGLGPEKLKTDRFEPVTKVKGISHIACGQNHTIAWSSQEKALYVWGDNRHRKRQPKDIALGSEHTICLATDNTFWAWGWNEHGNTGTGSDDAIFEPKLVQIELKTNVISQIYAGGGHNFIVIDETNVSPDEDIKQ
ncbi:Ultraviolet-B receptor UVR8 [Eumeta japonica]|uniref:Ultraviolet-B receptor UVR8 n=1 Tax=Eumeta variegata TaxID=151549 RepID=A0A4C1Y248_EUMVA|nr:Ultraviolet-B receptor UVR8 [Eumeta japonica]